MELLAYTINGQIIGIDIGVWSDTDLSGNTAFMAIIDGGTIPTDYVDISSTVYWDAFGGMTTLDDAEIKGEIVKLIPDTPTPEEFKILENYATAGLNSMTNVLSGITLGSVLGNGTYLTGVTDNKLTVVNNQIHDELIFVDKITGTSATFSENLSVDGQFNMGYVNQINTTQELIKMRYNAIAPVFSFSGLAMMNADGAGNNFLMGINDSGEMVGGWSGSTLQPIATGSTTGGTSSIYGSEYQMVASLGSSTTTATTPQTKVTLNTTTLPTGTYKITVAWMALHDSDKTDMRFDVNFNGTAEGTTVQIESKDVTSVHPFIRIFYLALNGTNTISLRYWNEGNSTTISDATIELIRVS